MEIERRDFAFEDDNELMVESRADGRAARPPGRRSRSHRAGDGRGCGIG